MVFTPANKVGFLYQRGGGGGEGDGGSGGEGDDGDDDGGKPQHTYMHSTPGG